MDPKDSSKRGRGLRKSSDVDDVPRFVVLRVDVDPRDATLNLDALQSIPGMKERQQVDVAGLLSLVRREVRVDELETFGVDVVEERGVELVVAVARGGFGKGNLK